MDGSGVAVVEASAISKDYGCGSDVRGLVPCHEAVKLICPEVSALYLHTGLITRPKLRYVTLQFEGLEKHGVIRLQNRGQVIHWKY